MDNLDRAIEALQFALAFAFDPPEGFRSQIEQLLQFHHVLFAERVEELLGVWPGANDLAIVIGHFAKPLVY